MGKATKIRVMLSSRCNDSFSPSFKKTLSEIRQGLKKEIETTKLFGRTVFEAWINEDAAPRSSTDDSWEACLSEVRSCDVLIVLANGNAGWAKSGSEVGICHAEYMEGLNTARGKVWLIALPQILPRSGAEGKRDEAFKAYLSTQSAFRGGEVTTPAELQQRVLEALADAVVTLTQRGVSAAASQRFDMGQALDWTRLDFRRRKVAMETVMSDALGDRPRARRAGKAIILPLGGKPIAVFVHAIPAAFSVAAARELVGRPFLHDHEHVDVLNKAQGPLHLIACHRSATETQATVLLGFPDATVVSGPFGIYVADDVQKVQFTFLNNCRDASQTRHALQRYLEWLEQTGEADILANRASSRAKIVKAIANEQDKT